MENLGSNQFYGEIIRNFYFRTVHATYVFDKILISLHFSASPLKCKPPLHHQKSKIQNNIQKKNASSDRKLHFHFRKKSAINNTDINH